MSNQLTELEVLQQLNIPDFRHVSKDKVITFASMLQNMEPEVIKKALDQFPEFAKMTLEALKDYNGVIEKTLDANSESSKNCFEIYNEVINALKSCLAKDELPFEEKKYYIDKMMEISKMAESRDSENKGFNWKAIMAGTLAFFTLVGLGSSILGGNTIIKLPKSKP